MRTVTEFNISATVVARMIAYNFLRGVLLKMHARSADGVLHLAIWANVDCFSLVPAKVIGKVIG